MAKNTLAQVTTYPLAFGGEGIALRAKLTDEQKLVLKQARGARGEYFAWDATGKHYSCGNDPDMLAFATALVERLNANAPAEATAAKPTRVSNALGLIAALDA
jgi:hypothetical protein